MKRIHRSIHRNLQNTIADVAVLVVLAAPLLVFLA
jgi:hypothetical protein